jgi:hypothetical protein
MAERDYLSGTRVRGGRGFVPTTPYAVLFPGQGAYSSARWGLWLEGKRVVELGGLAR